MSFAGGRAVVVATGGFAGNLDMVLQHHPRLAAVGRALAGGGVGAQGTGHEMLVRNGATLVNTGNIVIYVYATPDYEDPTGARGLVCRGIENCIWVNAGGERFHDESLNGGIYGATALLRQESAMCWAILDNDMAGRIDVADPPYRRGPEVLRDRVWQLLRESPFIASGGTPRELALKAGVDPDRFERTIAEWNALLASGADRDPSTGRKLADLQPFVAPPFYALQFLPLARKNQGGIKTDLRCRVQNTSGNLIPGLYAAGELCGFAGGHISGSRALEGIMLGGSLFSGRVAGAWAAYETGGREPTHLAAEQSALSF
jgi:predicted oxidoreductase